MVKFGYQPIGTGPLATPQRLRDAAIRAEESGFDTISVTDHVVLPTKLESKYPYNSTGEVSAGLHNDWFDPLALLGLWSGITKRVVLQTSVLVLPYRNPIITAKVLASIDALSGGRLEVGVGAGWMREEFDILQAPDFAKRGSVTSEYISIFRTLWDDQLPSFDGEFYQIQNLAMHPKPTAQPHLPILVGGNSKSALRRAARLGDGWQPLKVTQEDVAQGLAYIHQTAEQVECELTPGFQVSVRFGLRMTKGPTKLRPFETLDRVFVGNPDNVSKALYSYIDAGATAFMFDTRTCDAAEIDETLDIFISEVLPRFR